MPYEQITTEVADRVLTITLNRPDRLNAWTATMGRELIQAFDEADADDEVRAIIVTGAGRGFCAGADLAAGGDTFNAEARAKADSLMIQDGAPVSRDNGGQFTLRVFESTKPVIAAINGPAVGIGATMTLAMDVRLASDKARIGFVFGKIGIVPEACSSWFLPRIVGIAQALEWTYSADILDAEEARRGGLVKAVLPPDQLLPEACKLAHRIIDNRSPVSIALTRQMMYRNAAQPHPLEAHKVDSLAVYYTSLEDGKEGVKSFLEKRTPQYGGKASQMPPFYAEWIAGSNKP